MFVVIGFTAQHAAYGIDLRIAEIRLPGQLEHPFALGVAEELTPCVEQFEGVPLAGIVRGGDDDAAVGVVGSDCEFHARGGAEPDVDDVGAAAQERAFDQVADQRARDAGVAADDDTKSFARVLGGGETDVCGGEFDDVERREVVACRASDGAADARNGFDKGHV